MEDKLSDLELMLELMDEVLGAEAQPVEADDTWRTSYLRADRLISDVRRALYNESAEVAEDAVRWQWLMDLADNLGEAYDAMAEAVECLQDDVRIASVPVCEKLCIDHEHRIAYDNLRRGADSAK